MRKLHAVNDDEGGKKQVRKKGGRAERRSKRQADEKALSLRRVGRRRADIHERGSGGEGGREAGGGLFVPFCRRDELPLTSFSRLVQITTSHSLPSSGKPVSSLQTRGRRGGSNFYDTVIILQCWGEQAQTPLRPLCQPTAYPISCTLQIPSRTLH